MREDAGANDRSDRLRPGTHGPVMVFQGAQNDRVPPVAGQIPDNLLTRGGADASAWWEVVGDEEDPPSWQLGELKALWGGRLDGVRPRRRVFPSPAFSRTTLLRR